MLGNAIRLAGMVTTIWVALEDTTVRAAELKLQVTVGWNVAIGKVPLIVRLNVGEPATTEGGLKEPICADAVKLQAANSTTADKRFMGSPPGRPG